jgi:hypothetical protein
VVAELTERMRPTEAEYNAKREQLRAEAIAAKKIELRESYLKGLKAASTVDIKTAAIDQAIGGSS